MDTLTVTQTKQLPEVATSRTRELQWQVQWLTQELAQTKAHCELAWKIYNDAIDEAAPREQIDSTYAIARMFDSIRIATYRELDAAKRDYLALLN
mgnify:CR=1 FL=1